MGRSDQQRNSDIDENAPTLGALFRALVRKVKLEVFINLPATVVLYDHLTETATVTIGWLEIIRQLDVPIPNAEIPQPPKVLTAIPVGWPDNGAGDGSRFPIPPNTTGSVRVYDRSMASWMASPPGVPVDPFMAWTHALQDAVFWVDLRPTTVPVVPVVNPAAHVIRASTQLQCGGDLAVEGAVKDLSLQVFLIAAATAAAGAAVPTDGGIAAFTSFATSLAGLVAASGSVKVKVEP